MFYGRPELSFEADQMQNQSRIIRYVKPGTLPGRDLLSLYDESANLLIIDRDHFERLSDENREIVLGTQHSALLIEYGGNKPPRVIVDTSTATSGTAPIIRSSEPLADANDAEQRALALLAFHSEFQKAFYEIGLRALSPLGGPSTATLALDMTYLSEENVAATDAAHAAGMSPEEGVASLALMVDFIHEYKWQRTFWTRPIYLVRLYLWRPMPEKGTRYYYQRLLYQYAFSTWADADPTLRKQLQRRYRQFQQKFIERRLCA
jgi:hypothetical protein